MIPKMVKSLCIFVFSMPAIFMPNFAFSQEAWHGSRIGMTMSEIKGQFPTAKPYQLVIGDKSFSQFGFPSYAVADCTTNVNFHMEGGRLRQVELRLSTASEHQAGCASTLEAGLREKFGRPAYISHGYFDLMYWNRPDGGRVSIMTKDYPSIGLYSASITYFRPDRRAASAL